MNVRYCRNCFLMFKRLFLLALVLCMQFVAVTAQQRFTDVDTKVRALKANQVRDIGNLAEWISENFSGEEERLRAIYSWIANNIRYDMSSAPPSAVDVYQSKVTVVAFYDRKAVCEGYAGLMDSLSGLVGIPSHLVSGYTRINGELEITPHVWVSSYIGGKWWLSDPTWGSGAVSENRFIREFEPKFFMVQPSAMVISHMPYDPLWQFLYLPVSHEEFIKNTGNSKNTKKYFQFSDTLELFVACSIEDQYRQELRRINSQGFHHPAIDQRTNYLEKSIEIFSHNNTIRSLQEITQLFNKAVERYNAYVILFNKQQDKSDRSKQIALLSASLSHLELATVKINQIHSIPEKLQPQAKSIRKSVLDLHEKVENDIRKL